jgi:hypothetical protein
VGTNVTEDGVALLEKGVEAASESVVVELVSRNAEKQFGPGLLGPSGDVDKCGGLRQACGEQEAENLAV